MSQQTTKNTYYLIVKDKTDPDCLSRRLAVREQHLANLKTLKANSTLQVASAMVDKDGKMCGSIVLYNADSEEQAREFAENDEYYKNGVWDRDTLVIQQVKIPIL
ncbi:hypothetical protein BB559_005631 [Furculomyces boomerangus]|uniref:YCII-related domain-containing protein n=2 Tax=Harpellales TaxID=61421 RepID=A0A2T9Y7J4_9FUNG|nr:hypothetical protein BB559_005631 [Furculomyces boomerangus]PVZ97824.1 hypothetical protein BB558_006201 [Smittium angustum]